MYTEKAETRGVHHTPRTRGFLGLEMLRRGPSEPPEETNPANTFLCTSGLYNRERVNPVVTWFVAFVTVALGNQHSA